MATDNIDSAQLRGARAMLGWSQAELANRAGITRKTLVGLESGDHDSYRSTMAKVVAVLETAGVRFIDVEGSGGVMLSRAG